MLHFCKSSDADLVKLCTAIEPLASPGSLDVNDVGLEPPLLTLGWEPIRNPQAVSSVEELSLPEGCHSQAPNNTCESSFVPSVGADCAQGNLHECLLQNHAANTPCEDEYIACVGSNRSDFFEEYNECITEVEAIFACSAQYDQFARFATRPPRGLL